MSPHEEKSSIIEDLNLTVSLDKKTVDEQIEVRQWNQSAWSLILHTEANEDEWFSNDLPRFLMVREDL